MKLYNRNFGVGERIEYMGWVNEAVSNSNQPWQSYRPRFLALKGPDLLLFETPPVCVSSCSLFCLIWIFKAIINLFYILRILNRMLLFLVQHRWLVTLRIDFQSVSDDVPCNARIGERGRTAALLPGAESRKAATLFECWDQARTPASRGSMAHRYMFSCYAFEGKCIHIFTKYIYKYILQYIFTKIYLMSLLHFTLFFSLQSKTFPVTFNSRSAGLTLEWTQGFTLSYEGIGEIAWRYKFSQLRGSSDDGKSRLKLHFQEPDSIAIETKVNANLVAKLQRCIATHSNSI